MRAQLCYLAVSSYSNHVAHLFDPEWGGPLRQPFPINSIKDGVHKVGYRGENK